MRRANASGVSVDAIAAMLAHSDLSGLPTGDSRELSEWIKRARYRMRSKKAAVFSPNHHLQLYHGPVKRVSAASQSHLSVDLRTSRLQLYFGTFTGLNAANILVHVSPMSTQMAFNLMQRHKQTFARALRSRRIEPTRRQSDPRDRVYSGPTLTKLQALALDAITELVFPAAHQR